MLEIEFEEQVVHIKGNPMMVALFWTAYQSSLWPNFMTRTHRAAVQDRLNKEVKRVVDNIGNHSKLSVVNSNASSQEAVQNAINFCETFTSVNICHVAHS